MRGRLSSINHRALRRLTIMAIASGLLIIGLFYVIEMFNIGQRAQQALQVEQLEIADDYDETLPEVYYVNTDEAGSESLYDIEKAMIDYYQANSADIPYGSIRHIAAAGKEAFFFPMKGTTVGTAVTSDNVLLVYVDVSFVTGVVKNATYILMSVVVAIAVLMYVVELHTVRQLDAKDEGMKSFFANASHELKTPLMAIRGYADGLQEGIVTTADATRVIDHEADRMSSLIGGILEMSKLDGGMVEPHRADNDVREILYDALQAIGPAARAKNVKVSFELPEPLMICCDEEMIFSVFSNILTNSVRYAVTRITVNVSHASGAKPGLQVAIANDGPALSAAAMSHIFDRFYCGPGGQTGIGMALSRQYVLLHGGTITAKVDGGQTVFTVWLPAGGPAKKVPHEGR